MTQDMEEIKNLFRPYKKKQNLKPEEVKALRELTRNKNIVINPLGTRF